MSDVSFWNEKGSVKVRSVSGSAARAGLAVAQRKALRLVPLKVGQLVRLAAVASCAARDAAPQLFASFACADAAAGERAHRAARARRRAPLAASVRARAGVVLLRSWLQVLDQAVASSLVHDACCCRLAQS
jgi:hypothetical protein